MISRKLPLHLAAGTLALGMAIAAPAATRAQPTPGHVFLISSCFGCSPRNATVAGNAAGDFLGTWTELRDVVSDGVRQGYDLEQMGAARALLSIPLVASGGAGAASAP